MMMMAKIALLLLAPLLASETARKGCNPCRKPCRPSASEQPDCAGPCDPSACDTSVLMDFDFYKSIPILDGNVPTWEYLPLSVDGEVANNGTLTFGKCGGFLDSTNFTLWNAPRLDRTDDNYKFIIRPISVIDVPVYGSLSVDFNATVKTFGSDTSPFPPATIQENDLRLVAGAFIVKSPDSGLTFSFMLTNDRIYAIYSRARSQTTYNYAFSYAIPIARRKSCDWHLLNIFLDSNKHQVAWSVKSKELFRIKHVGRAPAGQFTPIVDEKGEPESVWPLTIYPAFGSMTWLDAYPPAKVIGQCGETCEYPAIREALVQTGIDDGIPASVPRFSPVMPPPRDQAIYWDAVGTTQGNHIWGQGLNLAIRRLRIVRLLC